MGPSCFLFATSNDGLTKLLETGNEHERADCTNNKRARAKVRRLEDGTDRRNLNDNAGEDDLEYDT